MPDIAKLKLEIQDRTGLSPRQINRLIASKESDELLSRPVATMAVARDRGVPIGKYASDDDLAILRGSPPKPPTASPPSEERPTPTRSRPRAASRRRSPRSGKKVFVVHGRNERLRKDLFDFLRAIGLQPLEWQRGLARTRSGSPSIKDILGAMFTEAGAVVVLLTPDDTVRLRPEFYGKNEPSDEKKYVGQARPNVLFEAGMAFGSHPDSVVLLQVGHVKQFTDVGGLHVTRLNNSTQKRQEVATKLRAAGCGVDLEGTDWHTTGHFELDEPEGK